MKKTQRLFALLLVLVFLTAGMSVSEKKSAAASPPVACDSLVPVLPVFPYDYDINFPPHAVDGWWTSIDPVFINSFITPARAALGRVLFYDTRLSASNDLSCASCHKQQFSFADNVQFSEGIGDALTTRNSPNLNDIAWMPLSSQSTNPPSELLLLFWDCRDNVLENMVLKPIVHEGELGKDLEFLLTKLALADYYPPLFEDAFGTSEVTAERIGTALQAFVRSMASFESKFDQVEEGLAQFTPSEEEGWWLFAGACGSCHAPSHFGTIEPMNNGLDSVCADLGMAGWSLQPGDVGSFKSPSLRNVAVTAPYMHDGRFETLEEVIDFYSEGVQPHPNSDLQLFLWGDTTGFNFTDQQKADLLAFLHTLTDSSFLAHPKWSDPFQSVLADRFLPLAERVVVFPNPFAETATVQLDNPGGEAWSLRLTTLEGRVLKTAETRSGSVVLKKDGLAAGAYLLEITKGNRRRTERLAVQ